VMKRRELFAVVGGASVWPISGGAQQKLLPLLGILMLGAPQDSLQGRLKAFYKALDVLGWTMDRDFRVEVRWATGDATSIERHAAEFVGLKPDVILANGTPVVIALKKATQSIPIVCALVQDPVGLGLVKSLARPGGNITGFTYINRELIGKWRGLLTDVAPSTKRAGLIFNPMINSHYYNFLRDLGSVPQGAIDVVAFPVQTADMLRDAMGELRSEGGAAILTADAFVLAHLKEAAALAFEYRLPTISVYRSYVAQGGLMSYGPDDTEIFRRSAAYVDRILKGQTPAELPVQQPDKFEFGLNLRTAKALGLSVRPSMLALADEVIE
jgi:putative ABC transport system substrate-binding protein